MKTIITTLNSKYIHTSLALRLLYVASYHRFDVDFKEYTIKDSLEHIVDDLLKRNCDIIAFSCYIWNIEYIEKICQMVIGELQRQGLSDSQDDFLDTHAHLVMNHIQDQHIRLKHVMEG